MNALPVLLPPQVAVGRARLIGALCAASTHDEACRREGQGRGTFGGEAVLQEELTLNRATKRLGPNFMKPVDRQLREVERLHRSFKRFTKYVLWSRVSPNLPA